MHTFFVLFIALATSDAFQNTFRRLPSFLKHFSENPDRPPIIPFDFAREDIPYPIDSKPDRSKIPEDPKESKKINEGRVKTREELELDRTRPTGYDTPDDDDDDQDENIIPAFGLIDENDNAVTKFLKNVYIGSPYDSRKKKQARYVVRNITAISVVIGIIFTGIWFVFPGKFISIRRDTDFTQRYQSTYIDPADLLSREFDANAGVYFDDGEGVPIKEEMRFAPPPPKQLFPLEDVKEEF